MSWITNMGDEEGHKRFPNLEPRALPPPVSDATLARPFNISEETYLNALHISVPVAVCLAYVSIATNLNRVNRKRANKPWIFSKTSIFYVLVLLHNVLLAAYSAWTFLGMVNTIKNTWPTGQGEHHVIRIVDALCKMHGPRGYGSAATFDPTSAAWSFTDRMMKLDQGAPDVTDVGRMWNEGLAFYGWLFYLSKFYEVFDTLIILAKGKNTSNFQTWHHAGAMFGTWAGIRYMSPPIWMFVMINAGIHSLMYTYYALNHLGIRVSQRLKSILTTMQIAQIVLGTTYAVIHLFVAYDIPVEMPYLFVHNLSSALPTAASSLSSALPSVTGSVDIGSWIKKAALRAAGEEGLAENVRNSLGETFGIDAVHAAEVEKAQEEIRYKMSYQKVNCLDAPGQTFAILLNLVYLVPLAFMFIRFFTKAYTKKAQGSSPPSKTVNAQQSGKSAARDIKDEIKEAMTSEQEALEANPPEIPSQVSSRTEKFNKGSENLGEKAKDAASEMSGKVKDGAQQVNDYLQDKVQAATDAASEKVNEANKKAKAPDDLSESKDAKASSDAKNSKDEPRDVTSKHVPESKSQEKKDDTPRLEPHSSTADGKKKAQSRSQSPQKKTQLPRPQSKNRQAKSEKKDQGLKEEDKPQPNGNVDAKDDSKPEETGERGSEEEKPSSLDESAYEVNPDELENEEEKKAQEAMQPKPE
ncbi:MAG: hypothetical protein Q9174_001948 [Haloplaca sp. 1 TL-2023]